jgi:hypothetical protein
MKMMFDGLLFLWNGEICGESIEKSEISAICGVFEDFYEVSREVAASLFSKLFECMICHIASNLYCSTHIGTPL